MLAWAKISPPPKLNPMTILGAEAATTMAIATDITAIIMATATTCWRRWPRILSGITTKPILKVKDNNMRGHHHHRRRFREAAETTDTGERATTRVQLEMPPQAMVRLQKMKDRTEAASYAEVIRNALRLFEALVVEHEKGSEFSLKRPDGEIVQYKIFV